MGILRRVEEIRAEEHMKLRRALARADRALREVERALIEEVSEDGAVDMWGDPIKKEQVAPKRQRVNLRPLFDVWEPFERSVLDCVDHWEMELWPLVKVWVGPGGAAASARVIDATSRMQARREHTQELLRTVRIASNFIPELRPSLMALFASLEVATRAEDEVIPGLMSGSPDVANHTAISAPPRHTAHDITRNLRALHFEDDDEEQRAGGMLDSLGRFMGWLRG